MGRKISEREFVLLDPLVEFESSKPGKGFGFHYGLGTGVSLPDSPELMTVLRWLKHPVRVKEFVARMGNRRLAMLLLESLLRLKFIYVSQSARVPTENELMRWRRRDLGRSRKRRLTRWLMKDPRSTATRIFKSARKDRRLLLELGSSPAQARIFDRLAWSYRAGELGGVHIEARGEVRPLTAKVCRSLFFLGGRYTILIPGEFKAWAVSPGARNGLRVLGEHGVETSICLSSRQLPRGPSNLRSFVSFIRAHQISQVELTDLPDVKLYKALEKQLSAYAIVLRLPGLPDDLEIVGQGLTIDEVSEPLRSDPRYRAIREIFLRSRIEYLRTVEGSFQNPQSLEAENLAYPPHHFWTLASQLNLRTGSTVLDVCGGMGRVSRSLAQYVGQNGTCVVIDRDPVSLDRGRRISDDLGQRNVQYRVGDARSLPFAESSVDAVLNCAAIDTFFKSNEAKDVVAEMARVLRKGGRALIFYPLGSLNFVRQVEFEPAAYPDLLDRVTRLYRSVGLRVDSLQTLGGPVIQPEDVTALNYSDFMPELLPRLLPLHAELAPPPPQSGVWCSIVALKS